MGLVLLTVCSKSVKKVIKRVKGQKTYLEIPKRKTSNAGDDHRMRAKSSTPADGTARQLPH